MKLLGGTDEGGGPGRTQDDAAVGYGFQRHPHEQEFSQFAQKQARWASGDDAIIDVCVKKNYLNYFFSFILFFCTFAHIFFFCFFDAGIFFCFSSFKLSVIFY